MAQTKLTKTNFKLHHGKRVSVNKLTLEIIKKYLSNHGELKLYDAKKLCEQQLGIIIRADYLICSLIGHNFFIDCDRKAIYRGVK